MRTKSWAIILGLAFFILFLSGCGAMDQEVYIYSSDHIKVESKIGFSTALVDSSGKEELDDSLDELAQDYKRAGAKMVWKEVSDPDDDIYVYEITVTSDDYRDLDDEFDIDKVKYDGRNALQFSLTNDYINSYSMLLEYELTLHARKILESNGKISSNDDSVKWKSVSSENYAIFYPIRGSGSTVVRVALYGLGIIGAIAIISVIVRSTNNRQVQQIMYDDSTAVVDLVEPQYPGTQVQSYTQSPPVPAQPGACVFCPECGEKNEADSRFCIICGNPLPRLDN